MRAVATPARLTGPPLAAVLLQGRSGRGLPHLHNCSSDRAVCRARGLSGAPARSCSPAAEPWPQDQRPGRGASQITDHRRPTRAISEHAHATGSPTAPDRHAPLPPGRSRLPSPSGRLPAPASPLVAPCQPAQSPAARPIPCHLALCLQLQPQELPPARIGRASSLCPPGTPATRRRCALGGTLAPPGQPPRRGCLVAAAIAACK